MKACFGFPRGPRRTVNEKSGKALINALLADPVGFDERGDANELLETYFGGMSLHTLRPLLAHSDGLVRRSATFVASELGYRVKPLIADVAPLIHDPDPHSRWYAVESVMVCSTGSDADWFLLVVQQLESADDWMRRLAMRLISNADFRQLETALKRCNRLGSSAFLHAQGLALLLQGDCAPRSAVTARLESPAPLSRQYGAIAAKLVFQMHPDLLQRAATSPDADVSRFSAGALEDLRGTEPRS